MRDERRSEDVEEFEAKMAAFFQGKEAYEKPDQLSVKVCIL